MEKHVAIQLLFEFIYFMLIIPAHGEIGVFQRNLQKQVIDLRKLLTKYFNFRCFCSLVPTKKIT